MWVCDTCGAGYSLIPNSCENCDGAEFVEDYTDEEYEAGDCWTEDEIIGICVCDCEICTDGGPDEHCEDCTLVSLEQ